VAGTIKFSAHANLDCCVTALLDSITTGYDRAGSWEQRDALTFPDLLLPGMPAAPDLETRACRAQGQVQVRAHLHRRPRRSAACRRRNLRPVRRRNLRSRAARAGRAWPIARAAGAVPTRCRRRCPKFCRARSPLHPSPAPSPIPLPATLTRKRRVGSLSHAISP